MRSNQPVLENRVSSGIRHRRMALMDVVGPAPAGESDVTIVFPELMDRLRNDHTARTIRREQDHHEQTPTNEQKRPIWSDPKVVTRDGRTTYTTGRVGQQHRDQLSSCSRGSNRCGGSSRDRAGATTTTAAAG